MARISDEQDLIRLRDKMWKLYSEERKRKNTPGASRKPQGRISKPEECQPKEERHD